MIPASLGPRGTGFPVEGSQKGAAKAGGGWGFPVCAAAGESPSQTAFCGLQRPRAFLWAGCSEPWAVSFLVTIHPGATLHPNAPLRKSRSPHCLWELGNSEDRSNSLPLLSPPFQGATWFFSSVPLKLCVHTHSHEHLHTREHTHTKPVSFSTPPLHLPPVKNSS